MGVFDGLADLIGGVVVDLGLGTAITYTSVTPGTYDPATGTSTPTTATQTVDAIIEDYRGLALLNGLVQAGDKKVTIPASILTATPKPSDTVTFGGHTYAIVGITANQAGDEIVLHVLQCRRA